MHLGTISFCDRIAYNIKSSNTKDEILEILTNKFGINILQRHWHKIDNNNVNQIIQNPHLACLRSNGNPYYLFFTRYEDIPIIYYIDKKIQPNYEKPRIILTRGFWEESIFDNTLLDGEMVKMHNGKWIFLINDVIAYCNNYLQNIPFTSRIIYAYELLSKNHTKNDHIDVCDFKVKQYANSTNDGYLALMEISKKLNYTNRGIYFWPSSLRYKPKLINFDDTLIKDVVRKVKDNPDFQEKIIWTHPQKRSPPPKIITSSSPESQNNNEIKINLSDLKTILRKSSISSSIESLEDEINESIKLKQPTPPTSPSTSANNNQKILFLKKTETPDIYNLFETQNDTKKIGIASISTFKLSKMLQNLFKNLTVAKAVAFNCEYNKQFNKWTPLNAV